MLGCGVERAFAGLWARYRKADPDTVTLMQIEGWALAKGLAVTNIERRKVGAFQPLECIVISTEQGKACLPIETTATRLYWEQRNEAYEKVAAIWKKLEWFSPLWVSRNNINKILFDAEHLDPIRAIQAFDYHTSTIYTPSFEAVCIEQIMASAECLADIRPLAREAFLAFYAGYKAASIASLIPAIEGAISKILPDETHGLATMERVNRAVAGAISYAANIHYDGMWIPANYKDPAYLFCMDERVFAFETFRRWLQDSFYKNTAEYAGATNLNRHLFAHGISADWQKASLSRLIVALATVGVIESWYRWDSSKTLFFPDISEDSKLLLEQAILHGSAQMVIKHLEEANYHQHGRSVPLMPTDDGATLRRALLMEDCIKDLVRPMREAGWNVEFEDDSSDIFLKVLGKHSEQEIKVALLYNCGTDNSIYKELEQDCNVILYRGGPYHQEEFARGINVYVGPVTGWQPPVCRKQFGE
ncbi:hypothetical protein [Pseudomonas luteola]|uniref:hypothetical protein n=1 Tax=Pseudomonas luteola TaxID=47886 RepID=UPI00123C67B9|nr:hypothetical protein [Pseudomonas luteola]QEU31504.1 hypothetical protein FOB45_27480 [Pseudomonas luteola]